MDPAMRVREELARVDEPEDRLAPVQLSDVSEAIQEACTNAGWRSLMPVQAHALPYLMAGRDLMVQSRTGSGKTGAFILPLLERLDPNEPSTQALVLVPTRELALQVEYEAKTIFAGTGLRVAAAYGGVGYGKQNDALRAGAHFVVGTPGRVLDHLLRRTLQLDDLRALTFDEADRMLSIGFYPDMKEIQRYLPRRHVPTCLFSATYPQHVLNLASEFLREPQMLSLSHNQVHVAQTHHTYCEARPMEKDRALVRLIEMENPTSAIIFCNTKANVHYVTAVLQGFGYNADELCADLSQSKRERVLERLRHNEVRFLVATDVAARGIDIPNLSHVFLYEPPEDRESYIHRAGRTGRAGSVGTVVSLVDIMQKIELQRIAQHYRMDIPQRPTPQDDDVAQVVTARLTALLEADYRRLTGLQKERLKRFTSMAHDLGNDEEHVALLAMLLDAHYQQTLHDAPPLPKAQMPERHEQKTRGQNQRERGERGERGQREQGQRQYNRERRDDRRDDCQSPRDTERDASRGQSRDQNRDQNPNHDQNMDSQRPQQRRRPRRRRPQGGEA
ncbi:MAG: DEAD/DEAH box helicase [Pseudomonadota bacterium]